MLRLQPAATVKKDGRQILVSFLNKDGKRRWACVRWEDDCWVVGTTKAEANRITLALPFTHWTNLPEHPVD